jgi:RNA polymerase sigma-70 factor (ECF subfamily)
MISDSSSESLEFRQALAAARAGSTEALGRLWGECRNYLLLVANQNLAPDLGGKVSASDLVQDTFLEAQRDFAQFHGAGEEELLAWLARILLNNLANVTRHYKGTERRALDREVPLNGRLAPPAGNLCRDTLTPSDKVMLREDVAALERALARLPEHYRQAIHLRYHEQLTFAAIGEALGCSAEAARKLWARAVDQLQRELNPRESP